MGKVGVVFLYLLGLTAHLVSAQHFCDSVDFPVECTCVSEGETGSIRCPTFGVTSPWIMKPTFDSIADLVDNPTLVLNSLFIDGESLEAPQAIPEDTIENLKFRQIFIYNNPFTSAHPNAFSGTYEFTNTLYFSGHSFNTAEPATFEFLKKFTAATSIKMDRSPFESFPARAFDGFAVNSLTNLTVYLCGLETIGDYAFAGLTSLEHLDLGHNDLLLDGISTNAFSGMNPEASLELRGNGLTHLTEEQFKPFLDNTRGTLGVGAMQLNCNRGVVDWICDNAEDYKNKIVAYYCTDSSNDEIFEYCSAGGQSSTTESDAQTIRTSFLIVLTFLVGMNLLI